LGNGLVEKDVDDMLIYGVLGTILGGRLGYVLFYKPHYYLEHPSEVLQIWAGGMSFHGGFLGVLLGLALFCWSEEALAHDDGFHRAARAAGAGRGTHRQLHQRRAAGAIHRRAVGHVVSAGRSRAARAPPVAALPGRARGLLPLRHPLVVRAQTAAAGAGFRGVPRGYGVLRFIAEFTRQPDDFLGLLAFDMSMGQWLSLPMIAIGAGLMLWPIARSPLPRKQDAHDRRRGTESGIVDPALVVEAADAGGGQQVEAALRDDAGGGLRQRVVVVRQQR
jgi:phosphatidylglycerol:prolipoprotein diacylglycerol transferase